MKKLFALLLAVVMVMSLATTAFAASGTDETTKGSITISDAIDGATYKIYQILELKSFDTDNHAYQYVPTAAWKSWIEDSTGGGKYLTINATYGNVEWIKDASVANFVADALAYAKATDGINPTATKTKTEGTDLVFSDLDLGYYLVESSIGAVCSIDGTVPNATIREKNTPPGNDKKVQDKDQSWQESTSASVGDTVTFASRLVIYAGTKNLSFHDKMTDGLTFVADSVKVYYTPMANGNEVAAANYTVKTTGLTHNDCTFEVNFTDAFLKTITAETYLTVVYNAVVNENAVTKNENDSKLTYGEGHDTQWDPAYVYTYKFGIVKTDESNNVLQGAEFKLYGSATGNDEIKLVADNPATVEAGVNYYRPATAEEQAAEGFAAATIEAGKACIWGIASKPLYLEETKAPAGYNGLTERYHITALQSDNMPTFTPEGLYDKGGVEIENLAGTALPQTGGVGTTLFYVFGGLMVVAAAVLLITKKRMSFEA